MLKCSLESFFNRRQASSENSQAFWSFLQGIATEVHLRPKDKLPRDIGNSITITLDTRDSNFKNQQWFRFHICPIMILYYKIWQILLQNAATILLQNAKKLYCKTRQVFYYKMWQFYYNLRQLLQNVSILLQNATAITNCGVYYKMRRYCPYTW